MQRDQHWKDRLGMVYSTNPDYVFETETDETEATLPARQKRLRVSIERSGRGGKVVTLVRGFVGTDDDLKSLGKLLKTRCGVGGSAKDGEIIVQGNLRDRVVEILKSEGYSDTK